MFEVVDFKGMYRAILGRPCYTKFMATPNYTYLKLKIPGLKGVITVGSSYRQAYECDSECCTYAAAMVASKKVAMELVAEASISRKHRPDEEAATTASVQKDGGLF